MLKVPFEQLGVDRRGHRDEPEVFAPRREPAQDDEEKVAEQIALVHLVDDDVGDPSKVRVGLQPPEEDAGGAEEEPGIGALPRFKPDAVPHGVAYALASLLRHALGDGDRAQPARLRDDHRALAAAIGVDGVFKHKLRHLRGLTAARRAAHHGRPPVLDAVEHLASHAVRGQVSSFGSHIAPAFVLSLALLRRGESGARDFLIRGFERLVGFVP